MVYRANLSDMLREQYEFKTKKETYLGISIKESEDLKKASLRLPQNFNRKLNFIRSNSLDFASFGFCNLRQGALVALPPSYFANSRAELADLIPPSGFGNFAGKTITMSEIEEKLDESDKNALLDSLVLSPDAKAFGVTRELTVASNFMLAMSDKFLDLICLSAAYWYSFRKTRLVKMQHFERRRVYLMTSLIAGIVILSSRLFIQRFVDRSIEKETCNMGLDCAEGSLEYYDKMLERNKILRKVLPNGEKLIDAEGNHLSKAIQVPLTNYYLYFPNNGMKLTERKKLCESEFSKMVINLVEKKNKAQLQMQRGEASRVESSRTANNSDKEWEIFKKIRLFLETKKGSGN